MIPLSVARMGLEDRAGSLYLSGCIVVSSVLYNDLCKDLALLFVFVEALYFMFDILK